MMRLKRDKKDNEVHITMPMPKLPIKKLDELKLVASQIMQVNRKITCIEMGRQLGVGKNLANKIIRRVSHEAVERLIAEEDLIQGRKLPHSLTNAPRFIMGKMPKTLQGLLPKHDKN